MKYIRTKDGIVTDKLYEQTLEICALTYENAQKSDLKIISQADTIEELIQIGDIVFFWLSSDDKEHCAVMLYDTELNSIKYIAITKLLIPVGEDYKCVAKGFPSFNLIKGRRYLVSNGELELL